MASTRFMGSYSTFAKWPSLTVCRVCASVCASVVAVLLRRCCKVSLNLSTLPLDATHVWNLCPGGVTCEFKTSQPTLVHVSACMLWDPCGCLVRA